jgi:hypothetical protein
MSERKNEDLGMRIVEVCIGIVIGATILGLNLLWLVPIFKKAFE